MKQIQKQSFGKVNEQEVFLYHLENENIIAEVSNYGATLVSLIEKSSGIDVLLGYDNAEAYRKQPFYMGASIGRVANRIAKGQFTLNGEEYFLYRNDRENSLHGGKNGFHTKIFGVREEEDAITFVYESFDLEEGYPGNLNVEICYRLLHDGIQIETRAVSDQDTLFAYTNHAYFNLDGEGDILNQVIQSDAEYYAPNDENALALEDIVYVDQSMFDFRKERKIREGLESQNEQIRLCGGYDHHFVVDGEGLRKMAIVKGKKLSLEVDSDYPGFHFYTANFQKEEGKKGKIYDGRASFCIEAEYFPNAINYDSILSKPIVRGGEVQQHCIQYHINRIGGTMENIKTKEGRQNFHFTTEKPIQIKMSYYDEPYWHILYSSSIDGSLHELITKNGIDYEEKENILSLDTLWDSHGVVGGSVLKEDGKIYYAYVGKRETFSGRNEYHQLLSRIGKNDKVVKGNKPLFLFEEGKEIVSCKVVYGGDTYRLFAFAYDEEKQPRILSYSSKNFFMDWVDEGYIHVEDSLLEGAKHIQIEHVGEQYYLFVEKEKGTTVYVCDFDEGNKEFLIRTKKEYPTKLYCLGSDKDVVYMVVSFIDQEEGCEVFSLIHSLEMKEDILKENILSITETEDENILFEAKDGRILKDNMQGKAPLACSVEITNPALDNLEFALYANLNKKGLCLHYEKRRKLLFISDEDLENTQGYTFKQECEEGLQTVKLFVDHGLVEILINDDQVYTLYIYLNKNERLIRMGGNDISLVIKGK